jgi:hypothetical protein
MLADPPARARFRREVVLATAARHEAARRLSRHDAPRVELDAVTIVRTSVERLAELSDVSYDDALRHVHRRARIVIGRSVVRDALDTLIREVAPSRRDPRHQTFERGPRDEGTGTNPHHPRTLSSTNDTLHVADAGLILLWPFLGHYFDRVGLVAEGRFKTDADAERAVLLLRHLATGEAAAPEPVLTLHKLLCGVAAESPVFRSIDITPEESTLATSLLHAVTQQWTPLRDTSIEALRETFLRREGRLARRDDGWTLTVAKSPFDMLLDSLPWNITTVRLSWMHDLLHVQWRK